MSETERSRLTVGDVNPLISCILCGGYFIDATTITECLHSFCRACIVRYLETSNFCPVCDVQVHKTRPLRCIRSDKMLQDIVYKMVPGLYQNEMKRRQELYASQPPEAVKQSRDEEDRGEGLDRRYIFTEQEVISLVLTYKDLKTNSESEIENQDDDDDDDNPKRRFLRCPSGVKISHLKKLLQLKYSLPLSALIAVQHQDELLLDDYTLVDVAYISKWKRNGPIQLTFTVLSRPKAIPKRTLAPIDHVLPDLSSEGETRCKEDETPLQNNNQSSDVASDKSVVCERDTIKTEPPPVSKEITAVHEHKSQESPQTPSVQQTLPSSDTSSPHPQESKKIPRISKITRPIERKSFKTHVSCEDVVRRLSKSLGFSPKEEESSNCVIGVATAPKVPKLTIPLTPKILQMAAQHAEDDKMDTTDDSDLCDGRLVIVDDIDVTSKASDDEDETFVKRSSEKLVLPGDFPPPKKDPDDYEVDSGRGSDSSSQAEAQSLCGDEIADSPASSSVLSPDSDKPDTFSLPSPVSKTTPEEKSSKEDYGVLDLSTCRSRDSLPPTRPRPVANPPILDKLRQTAPCLPFPSPIPFKLFPNLHVSPSNSVLYSKNARGGFRCGRGSTLTVINPDPNSCRPKIVIKNLDPRPDHRHHHHHHHHHHHGHHHHPKM